MWSYLSRYIQGGCTCTSIRIIIVWEGGGAFAFWMATASRLYGNTTALVRWTQRNDASADDASLYAGKKSYLNHCRCCSTSANAHCFEHRRMTQLCHDHWRHKIIFEQGDVAVDATCGKGRDAKIMLDLMTNGSKMNEIYSGDKEKASKLICVDKSEEAIQMTKRLLRQDFVESATDLGNFNCNPAYTELLTEYHTCCHSIFFQSYYEKRCDDIKAASSAELDTIQKQIKLGEMS